MIVPVAAEEPAPPQIPDAVPRPPPPLLLPPHRALALSLENDTTASTNAAASPSGREIGELFPNNQCQRRTFFTHRATVCTPCRPILHAFFGNPSP